MAIDLMNIERNVVTSSPLDKIFLFYGEPGTRKTTVAAGDVEKTLLIAFEIGYKFIPGVMAQPVTKWYQFKEIINQLDNIEIKKVFSTVVIDTVGISLQSLCIICLRGEWRCTYWRYSLWAWICFSKRRL